MIAQLRPSKRWFIVPCAILLVAGAMIWRYTTPLASPAPEKQELVVLTHPGALTYDDSDPESIGGFEHDLVELFAKELNVRVRYVLVPPGEIASRLRAHTAHLAAAWASPLAEGKGTASPPFHHSRDMIVQHESSLPIDHLGDLAGKTLHVIAGSRQAALAENLRTQIPDLNIIELHKITVIELLEKLAQRQIELAIVDSAFYDVALQYAPSLQASLQLGPPRPIAWLFPENASPELAARANEFIQRIQQEPQFARIRDRYFGHIRRLDGEDIARFIEHSRMLLPGLRPLFHAAQAETGIDWRLLAALAYQESQWNPLATSPTGVRGIMMLTEDTADHLGVSNRLDPRESILAGARYLEQLRQLPPAGTPEPERTWLALSAYNIGPGHFRAALTIGKQLKTDITAWHEMKGILPLLAKPQYYSRLKSGRARGGEAVILVENVRSYYDILCRHEAPYRPLGSRGLKLAGSGQAAGTRLSLPPM